jgi:hypothetical protein
MRELSWAYAEASPFPCKENRVKQELVQMTKKKASELLAAAVELQGRRR